MTQHLPLEDTAADIIAKARCGLGISSSSLASLLKLPALRLHSALQNPAASLDLLPAIAAALELDATALANIALGAWHPNTPAPPDGFAAFTTPFSSQMTVNNYLLWNPHSLSAAVFDTGTDASALLTFAHKRNLLIRNIFITHTHSDHIAALDQLISATHATVHISEHEPLPPHIDPASPDLVRFAPGTTFETKYLTIKALDTRGHSRGQTTFLIHTPDRPIAVTGDALFAGSMGGSIQFYRDQRRNSAQKILTLPPSTLIAPGHGPLSTVQNELSHNPVFSFKP
ncbi:MAG: MBL fold metallo-hydrolase [Puniceicoccales bacterium]|jgi:glyoxylase-like metal-dependent hydrolase (beta-lactamase superfamily II)|nr:MBL fold metallo-hydrolase [Puniceicoccales bacterium]